MSTPIVHVDRELLVVDKPAGLLCVPGRTSDKQDCVASRLRGLYPEVYVVHRLDRDTSGVMLFARTRSMQSDLGRLFSNRSIRKEYVAWVRGRVAAEIGEISWPIGRVAQSSLPPRYQVDTEHGRQATTHWRVLDRDANRTRLLLHPATGRSHQLRVHLCHLGHPIVGDPIYGQPERRMYLHAHRLSFVHPRRGVMLDFSVHVPF